MKTSVSIAFENALKNKFTRGWDTIYWCIDVHDTILKGKYESDQDYEFYPGALKALKWISDQPDHRLIIWTCSYASEYDRLKDFLLKEHNIVLDYHNENPECGDTKIAEFTSKFYFNILVDDKAGFEAHKDWGELNKSIATYKDLVVSYDDSLQKLADSIVGKLECRAGDEWFRFSMYEVLDYGSETTNMVVASPDIQSDKPLVEGAAIIKIDDWEKAKIAIDNPTWKDVIVFFANNHDGHHGYLEFIEVEGDIITIKSGS